MKIWVLSSCNPDECRPCWPGVFLDEDSARKAFAQAMQDEWKYHAPLDDDSQPLPFPVDQNGDPCPHLANTMMANDGDRWGEWMLTCHDFEE